VDVALVRRLCTAEGAAALAAAAAVDPSVGPLVAATTLRGQGIDAELASAALTQTALRRSAVAKFGPHASALLFTRPGLEQATRHVVADRRAARLAAGGVTRVADLGCGIGADTLAFARAGLRVLAVDADPLTAAVAAANVAALGLADAVEVRHGDATAVDLSTVDGVFCDPARRDTARGQRVFDPHASSPPWSFVAELPVRVPATVLKLAPGIDHALIPAGAEAQWVSVDGDVVEAALWHGPLAQAPRRATVLRHTDDGGWRVAELTGDGRRQAPVGAARRFVYDPDGAVVRSHLVAEFASTVDGSLADEHIAYVFADHATATPLGTCLEILTELPYGLKSLRAALRTEDIGALEIRKRGVAVDPDRLRRDLRLSGSRTATLILTRWGSRPVALLATRVASTGTGAGEHIPGTQADAVE
jgi:SAM-dependent methyltransferase